MFVEITKQPLDLNALVRIVANPTAGAIATFIGVTRDNFNDKEVVKLEYEAYIPMALKELGNVCEQARKRWDLVAIALAHRIGTVAVGEASVIIVASSPHRKDALEAVHWVIDELKATVPIWKKEFFKDGEIWKENAENRVAVAPGSSKEVDR